MGNLSIKKEFKYKYSFGFYKEFLWKTGNLSEYWYQVVGCCKDTSSTNSDSCPPFKTDDTGCNNKKSFYFQTLLAYSVEDVCQQLIDNNWTWEICSIKKWSKPAENAYVLDPKNDCNFLQEVNFKDIPECISLSVSQKPQINIKFNMLIDDFIFDDSKILSLLKQQNISEDISEEVSVLSTKTPTDYEESLNQLKIDIPKILVNCSQCTSLSTKLYCSSNLIKLGDFSNFISNIGQEFDTNFSLVYSKNNDSWNKNFYYEGINNSGFKIKWNIYFELACTSKSDIEYFWKFLILFKKLENNVLSDSKLTVEVPSEFVCGYNSEFIFNFNFNTIKNYLFTNINYFRDDFVFYDNIGLFSTNYWYNNPEIYIRITENYDPNLITRKKIDY